jgi:molybdopterin synthase sulfur carrier subunit
MGVDLGVDKKVAKTKLFKMFRKCHFLDNILCAVNQEIANDEVIVSDSDEVAFYPPVKLG